jgi:hypothetical protein
VTKPSAGLLELNMIVTTPELYHIQPLPEFMLIDDNAPGESSTTGHKRKRAADTRNSGLVFEGPVGLQLWTIFGATVRATSHSE